MTFIWSQNQAMYIIQRPSRSSGSTEGSLEEAGRAEQHIITEAAPKELKLVIQMRRQTS